MGAVIWWMIVGLVAGWLAKLVVPGREPGGFFATMIIGLIGSLIGGFIAGAIGWTNIGSGILVAFIGAVVLLLIYHAFVNNRGRV